MRMGISPFASTREGALALSAAAVEGGLDTLWLGDGYLSNPDFGGWAGGMESMVELAWLGGRFPGARITMRPKAWTIMTLCCMSNFIQGSEIRCAPDLKRTGSVGASIRRIGFGDFSPRSMCPAGGARSRHAYP